jgi:drug/metabolite transporter (DMT)-like permease
MEMLIGGALFFPLSAATGEWAKFSLAAVSLKSALALLYLIVFGAIVAFTAYVYLLKNTTPARASTYAYVNPVIAVLLGWAFGGEAVTGRVVLAAAAIIAAVAVITRQQAGGQSPTRASRPTGELATDSPTAR